MSDLNNSSLDEGMDTLDKGMDTFETNILVDKFEKYQGQWTFEFKDGRYYPISDNPEKFLGDLVHVMQKIWFTKEDARVLIDWAVTKFKWNIHDHGQAHNPYALEAASENPNNFSYNQPKD